MNEAEKDASRAARAMLRSLWRLFAGDRRALLWVVVFGVLAGALSTATATVNRAVVGQFAHSGAVWRPTSIWVLLLVAVAASSGVSGLLAYRVGASVVAQLTETVFDRLARQSLRYHQRSGVSEAHTILTRCMQETEWTLSRSLSNVIPALALGVGGLVAMSYMNWRWTLVAAPLLACVSLSGSWVARRQRRVIAQMVDLDRRAIEIIGQVLDEQRLRVVKRNALEDVFIGAFADVSRRREQLMRQRSVGWTIRMQLYSMVPLLGAPIVWLVARASTISVAEAASIAALLPQMLLAVTRLTDWYVELAEVWPYVARALRVLDEPLATGTSDGSIRAHDLAGQSLVLSGVHCELGGHAVLARGRSGRRHPALYTVIMGPNGAGKTTLIDVITGLIPAQGEESSVRIGTVALSRVPPEVRAGHIRVIDSTPTTFAGTARENIALFRPDASEAEIRWACAIAQIENVDWFLAQAAHQLSTGEKERLVLAQAGPRQTGDPDSR